MTTEVNDPGAVVMPFGKHRGKTLEHIADDDVTYIDWLMGILDTIHSERLRDAIQAIAARYADDIKRAVESDRREGTVP